MDFNICSITSGFPALIAVIRGVFPAALVAEMLAPLLVKTDIYVHNCLLYNIATKLKSQLDSYITG